MNQKLKYYLITIPSSILALELLLWICGYRPYRVTPFQITSEPTFCIVPDSILGFGLENGTFEITVNEALIFKSTHQAGRRITGDFIKNENTKRIDLHGCSFLYGYGNDDSLTYPFLLQKNKPTTEIRNYGVPGYGTIQTLLLLENQLKNEDKPDKIIVHYADFHNTRNTLSIPYRKSLINGFVHSNEAIVPLFQNSKMPYFSNKNEIAWENWTSMYRHWKGRNHFCLVNAFQNVYENLAYHAEVDFESAKHIFIEIKDLCEANQIEFVIALIAEAPQNTLFLDFCKKEKIHILDMSLPLDSEIYTHLPIDSHPNTKAHKYYTKEMTAFLNKN